MQTLTFLVLLLWPASAFAASFVTLDAIDSGHYSEGGFHESTNENIITGQIGSQDQRHFVVFDLSSIAQPILGASLEYESPATSYSSIDPSEDLEFFDVVTATPILRAGGTLLTAIYLDLGSGTSYGGAPVSAADNGTTFTLALGASAIADMGLVAGLPGPAGEFAIGGAITSLGDPFASQHFFSGTNGTFRRLVLLVPEPAAGWLLLLALVRLRLRLR